MGRCERSEQAHLVFEMGLSVAGKRGCPGVPILGVFMSFLWHFLLIFGHVGHFFASFWRLEVLFGHGVKSLVKIGKFCEFFTVYLAFWGDIR